VLNSKVLKLGGLAALSTAPQPKYAGLGGVITRCGYCFFARGKVGGAIRRSLVERPLGVAGIGRGTHGDFSRILDEAARGYPRAARCFSSSTRSSVVLEPRDFRNSLACFSACSFAMP